MPCHESSPVLRLSSPDSPCEPVTQQVEAQHCQSNRYSRRGSHMGRDQQELTARIEHVAPRWSWRTSSQAKERERSFGYDNAANAETCLHHNGPRNTRQQMTK